MKRIVREIGIVCIGVYIGVFMLSCGGVGESDRRALECYQQGRELRAEGRPLDAMRCFVEAANSGSEDYRLLGRVYSNMANMCRQAERHDEAYALYEQSTALFRKANDSLAVSYGLNNMAWEKAVIGAKDEALTLVDSAVFFYPSEEVRRKVEESLSVAYLYADELDSAIFHAHAIEDKVYGEMLLAQAFALREQCDSALYYAARVTEQTTNPRYLDDTYYILAHCDSSAATSDVVSLAEKRTDVQRDLERFKSEMAQAVLLIRTPSTHKRLWFCVSGIVLGLGIIIGLGLLVYKRREQQQKVIQTIKRLQQSKQLQKEIQVNDYQAFCNYADTQLCGLAGKLQKRGLSDREVRIAVLVLLGFSYSQIADMLNRAENGIGKDKYVIAKKLGVSIKGLKPELLTIVSRN